MFSEAKVTEIYCLADDFCKEFSKYQEKHMFSTSPKNGKHRNKPNRMSAWKSRSCLPPEGKVLLTPCNHLSLPPLKS